jgi:CRISPR system Cascade subunit CasE
MPHPPLFFRRGNRGGKITAVTFEGVLNVLDPAALVLLLQNGIGPAKAFGCGLMLVRRITEI